MILFLSRKFLGMRELRKFDDLVISMFIAGYTRGLRGYTRKGYAKAYAEVCAGYTRLRLAGIRRHSA